MSFLRKLPPLALALGLPLSISAIACSAPEMPEYEDDEGAIINGQNSGSEDDAVVAVYRRGQPHCAATLIAENVLVTALHCVTEVTTTAGKPMLGERIRPNELSIRMGARPSRTSASVSKILVPDPVRMDSGQPVAMGSNDLAVLYVQPTDQAFAKLKPRRIGQRGPQLGTTVTVVGYGGEPSEAAAATTNTIPGNVATTTTTLAQRQKRDTEVVAIAGQATRVSAELDTGETIPWQNQAREFTTKTVACGGDSGGPAFDTQGDIVGLVSAVVGKCVEGSLSVFTDLASHADFLRRAIGDVKSTVGCLSDSQCGGMTSGRICDSKTNRCILGCRTGGNQCPSGGTCSVQGRTENQVGICRSQSGSTDVSDPIYDRGPYVAPDMPNITCPGNPLCPTTTPARECTTDTECNGINGQRPRVCDVPLGRCLDGCRVAAAPTMCAVGQLCGAYQDDPAIGVCQAAKPPPPPPGPPASPPVVAAPTQPAATDPAATTPTETTPTTTTKKKKNKAKGEEAGCSVSIVGNDSLSSGAGAIGFALLGLASMRRRRRS